MSDAQQQLEQMKDVLRKSLVTIKKLEAEVSSLKSPAKDAVAIVGMGCRMPGGVHNAEDLWQMLAEKKDAIGLIPEDRWDREATYDADPLAPGKTNTRHGAFLTDNVRAFDAGFFGISPREAKSIDPLQRLLLEVTQEAFESAGIAPSTLKGSKTGVYLGLGSSSDYAQASLRSGHLDTVSVYDTTGIPLSTAAGRLSYLFDFQGPSFAVDAACSSAIAAIHLAAEGLTSKACDFAVAGSANLMLTPELFIGLSKMGSLAPDGICRAFDEEASGYVRGEGGAVVLLKRLSDAERDGDEILAIIRGSALEHDGLSNGFTAPNPTAQFNVIRKALETAGVDAGTIDFVETHGVGNKFTDALELQAIAKAYGKRKEPLYIGSVKPNIGHMEAAVGMAMLAKVIGAFRHRQIPPNIHLATPNKDIDWERTGLKVPTELVDWQRENPLRAAINVSAYSGTNAHLILEAPGERAKATSGAEERSAYPVQWSAHSAEALHAMTAHLKDAVESNDSLALKDLSYTLATGRSDFRHKLAVLATDKTMFLEAISAWMAEGKHKSVKAADPELVRNREVAMLFTGQGAQYPGMCKTLYEEEPVFREAVTYCDKVLQEHLGESIIEVMYGDDSERINRTEFTQPALFVVEYGLFKLWEHWGIRPSAVAGHSVGEYVALTVAGVLTLDDALALIAARGKYIQSLPEGEGGMAAVLAPAEDVAPYLEDSKVDIAAINSPKSLTISGHLDEVAAVVAKLKENKIKAISLTVSHAFHSYQMDPILKDFEAVVARVNMQAPVLPVMSNVTGAPLQHSDLSPEYFSSHIRGTVRFMDNIKYLDEELGIDIFLEAGPNPTLMGLAKQTVTKPEALLLSSAKNGQNEREILWDAAQQLYLSEVAVRWDRVLEGTGGTRVALPTYPWQREEYWYDPVRGLGSPTAHIAAAVLVDGAPKEVSKDNLMELMQKIARKILGLEKGARLDEHKPLREQGFDSMMSGEFLAILEKYVGAKLEMSLIHVYGDLHSLYNYIVKDILAGGENTVTLSQVMFDTGNSFSELDAPEDGDWHKIKESDGPVMKLFKKFDRMLGVDDK